MTGHRDQEVPMGARAPVPRRTFLKVSGLTVAALFGGTAAAHGQSAAPSQSAGPTPTPAPTQPPDQSIVDLAISLDYDQEAIFRFVADEVRYDPYIGVLRGANGTLAARAGNSVDQALLLSALLDVALVEHRFAVGSLDASTVDAVMAAAAPDAATVVAHSDTVIRAAGAELAAAPAPTVDDATRALLDAAPGLAGAVDAAVTRQLHDAPLMILGALRAAGVPVASSLTPMPRREQEQHTWVQVASSGQWLDLDPTLPGWQSGQPLVRASSTPAALDDALRHRVTFRAVLESAGQGALGEDVVLEHVAFADQLVGTPVAFLVEKPEGFQALGVSLAGTLTGTVQYVPLLIVGDSGTAADRRVTFGGGGDIFSSSPAAGLAEGESTALWLEVTVESPEAASLSARRPVFDRIGAGPRSAGVVDLGAVPPVEFVDLGDAQPSEYLPCRTVHLLSVGSGWSPARSLTATAPAVPPYGLDAFAAQYHGMREGISALWGAPLGVRAFCDSPSVLSITLQSRLSGSDVASSLGLDLWHRGYGVVGVRGSAPPPNPGVLAGVIGHVAERTMLGDVGAGGPLATSRLSVGALFEEAARQGIAPRVLAGVALPAGLPYTAEAMVRVNDALRSGLVVIVPERPVPWEAGERLGWWLVDPATGATSDMLDDGRGTSMVEYAERAWAAWQATPWWQQLGVCLLVNLYIADEVIRATGGDVTDPTHRYVTIGGLAGAYVFDKIACGGASPPAPK